MKIGKLIVETEEQRAQAMSAHWKNATYNAGVRWLEALGFSADYERAPRTGNFDYARPEWGFIIFNSRPHDYVNINGMYWRRTLHPPTEAPCED